MNTYKKFKVLKFNLCSARLKLIPALTLLLNKGKCKFQNLITFQINLNTSDSDGLI